MICKYPYPYKAWFTLSSDPDFTNINDWKALDNFIWKELQLPLSNSLFLKSINHNLPDQVNLADFPEILSQYHDTLHTWGDYMHGRSRGFDRIDAEEALKTLKENNIHPRVWVDHSKFLGNLLHHSNLGAVPETKDMSGHTYVNYYYSLDLIKQAGIRYVWNGKLTSIIGQDTRLSANEFFLKNKPVSVKGWLKLLLYTAFPVKKMRSKLRLHLPSNEAYHKQRFADGNEMYSFVRYGTWKDADIHGLGRILSPVNIAQLLQKNGTMIAYTHLGKRPYGHLNDTEHIPESTKIALRNIQKLFVQGELNVSPLSHLLDYLVLRDHCSFKRKQSLIHFRSDGLRYEKLTLTDLRNHRFSFLRKGLNIKSLKVIIDDAEVVPEVIEHPDSEYFSILFR